MNQSVETRLKSLQFGPVQTYKHLHIVPLLAPADGVFQYGTLGEALAGDELAVTEVSSGGSVPDLQVVHKGPRPTLLVDGEELAGAKQNRVLNTSILLREHSETKIPVSCTEQGRWHYTSAQFSESGNILTHKSRSRKSRSVSANLMTHGSAMSDQCEVWDGIADLQAKSGTHSPTSAMSDVYKARDQDLLECEKIFEAIANQVGILAIIGGSPAGADLVSLTGAYARLHGKLVRSYVLEGLFESHPQSDSTAMAQDKARQFLDEVLSTEEHEFPTLGYGTEFRYRTAGARASVISGSALVHCREVIHAAFFRLDETEEPRGMASLRLRRRRFRE